MNGILGFRCNGAYEPMGSNVSRGLVSGYQGFNGWVLGLWWWHCRAVGSVGLGLW